MTETQRKRKVWTWLKANGWANVGPGQWSNGTRTIDLDAAMVRDGKLRATWAVIEYEIKKGEGHAG